MFPKQPPPVKVNPLTATRALHAMWSKKYFEDYQFSSGLEAWPDSSYAREKALQDSHGGADQTTLGMYISCKAVNLAEPLYSTDAEVRA